MTTEMVWNGADMLACFAGVQNRKYDRHHLEEKGVKCGAIVITRVIGMV